MPYLNTVLFIGRVVREPDLRHTTKGTALLAFTLVTTYRSKEYEETCFLRCEKWGDWAERLTTWITKDSLVLVTGRLKTNSWTTSEGERRNEQVLMCDRVTAIEVKEEENDW